jgi:6-phosphogluconolactonase
MPWIIRPSINLRQHSRWHSFSDITLLEQSVTKAIQTSSNNAIRLRGEFHFVLAGGTTPRHIYEKLKDLQTNWHQWHIYLGDERCLPVSDSERNSYMVEQSWLKHVNIPPDQIHMIPTELGTVKSAYAYTQILHAIEKFDLVILGLGEDGHTASLFPHHQWGTTSPDPQVLVINDAPKPPKDRVSLSAWRLSQTRQLFFIVTGTSKKQAVSDWRAGIEIPASAITPDCGVDIYIEESLI